MTQSALRKSSANVAGESSTPERLLDTAAALFREKGYGATTTREIAAAVGIQQASLYYHAKSKEELLYKVLVSSLDRLELNVTAAVAAESDPARRIHAFIRCHLVLLLQFQQRNFTMLTELRALTGRYRSEVMERRKRYATLVRSVLEQAQAAGIVRDDIPAKYLYLALLNLLNWSTLWFRPGGPLTPEKLAAFYATLFLEGAATDELKSSLRKQGAWTQERKSGKRAAAHRSKSQTSRRLLVAAASLFAKKGYTMTSMREIADLVGVQKASLYYHIDTKEDLLFAICESSLERMVSAAERVLKETQDPLDRTRRFILAHIECVLEDQDLHAAALAEMRFLSEARLQQVVSTRQSYKRLLDSVLLDAQRAGVLRGDLDVKHLALGLVGMMNRVEMWYRRGGPLSTQQLGDLFASVFLTGTLRLPQD